MSAPAQPRSRPRVVILGGGFGGLSAARALKRAPVEVVVVDKHNHHLFQPLLYEVATAGLSAPDIATPIRQVLRRQRNATVLMEEATGVDLEGRRLLLQDGELAYDHLILAAGMAVSYFGHDEWSRHAPGLKNLEDAFRIRRRILLAFEAAEREPDPERRQEWLTSVVIGGGPTGVEIAGALADIAHRTLARDFRNFDPSAARVILLEGGDSILPTFPPSLRERGAAQLARLGVQVRTGAMASAVDERGVQLGEERIAARTVIWAAGLRAPSITRTLGAPLDEAGRVKVQPDLSLPGHPEVLVIGDLAALEQDGKPLPGIAPAAMQMGRHAADSIRRSLANQPRQPFRYRDKGSLATIGRSAAVADFGRVRLSGFPAWIAWLLVHIFFLIGFRNRLIVMFQWAWWYFTFQRSSRVILSDPRAGGPSHGSPGQDHRSPEEGSTD